MPVGCVLATLPQQRDNKHNKIKTKQAAALLFLSTTAAILFAYVWLHFRRAGLSP